MSPADDPDALTVIENRRDRQLACTSRGWLRMPGRCAAHGPRGTSEGRRWVAHYQGAINEQAVTIDPGGCAAAGSEHSVIAKFGMTFLFLR